MALTAEQKQYYMDVIARTGGHRETMKTERHIPEDYLAWQEKVERNEQTLDLPGMAAPVRLIRTAAKDRTAPCPVHVNLHGGGFVYPQDGDDDLYCAHLAGALRGIVVDVDYALSQDHPFPAAFDQCYLVTKWVFSQCEAWGADPKRVSLGGHSAGGNLTAAVSLKAARTGEFRLCLQVLDYSATDSYMALEQKLERSVAFSMLYGDGSEETLKSPYCSPCYAPDEMLRDQPSTLIVGAGLCPFREVNEQYALRLARAGTPVQIQEYPESHHAFTVRMIDDWQAAQEVIIRAIREASL